MEPTKTASPFKRKRAITLPTFKFEQDKPLYCKILTPMHEGRVRLARGQTELDPDKKPPTLATVVNLESGELGQIILAEVLKTELSEAYPNNSYVGKGFEITKQKRKEGKRYDPYALAEIEVPEAFAKMTLESSEVPVTPATPDAAKEPPKSGKK